MSQRLLDDKLRLRHGPLCGIDKQQGSIHHAQHPAQGADKVVAAVPLFTQDVRCLCRKLEATAWATGLQ